MTYIVDSSAILAVLLGEHGADAVRDRLDGAAFSAVTASESYSKLLDRRYSQDDARLALDGLGLLCRPLVEEAAWRIGALRSRYRRSGLSFADCACLALAAETGLPALTGDRLWAELDHGIPVEVFR